MSSAVGMVKIERFPERKCEFRRNSPTGVAIWLPSTKKVFVPPEPGLGESDLNSSLRAWLRLAYDKKQRKHQMAIANWSAVPLDWAASASAT
jgi:hypothetical protein